MSTKLPPVRRIGRGVFVVDDRGRPKLSSREKNLVKRLMAASTEDEAIRLLIYLQKKCLCKFLRCL